MIDPSELDGDWPFEDSSAIDHIEYDSDSETATVYWKGGAQGYDFDVPPEAMHKALTSPMNGSIGQHVAHVWKTMYTK